MGRVTGADVKCKVDVRKPTDGSTYKAFLVDWILKANTRYQNLDRVGTLFTTNANAIFNPVNIALVAGNTVKPNPGGSQYIWTGW
ncbi:hypothetical protein [Leptospira harrisiae]|uniref:Uncharacterized protein n=1 Tax=Leptospira harrisiae TaxID=2023189 RepID=A0A2N0AMC1_9LEPT|nr:hypothetical protein [Leptospira harrisiae]PJZ85456.1 hypothetical protein CH364_04305 [Leptospira harrisiae]PKA08994.1 hypothetical protein CH366_04445 [Leptospira harrisiae]